MIMSLAVVGMVTLSSLGDAPVRGERPSLIADELASLRLQRPTLREPVAFLASGGLATIMGVVAFAVAGRTGESSYLFFFGGIGLMAIGAGLLITGTILLIVRLTARDQVDARIHELESESPRPPPSAYLLNR